MPLRFIALLLFVYVIFWHCKNSDNKQNCFDNKTAFFKYFLCLVHKTKFSENISSVIENDTFLP